VPLAYITRIDGANTVVMMFTAVLW